MPADALGPVDQQAWYWPLEARMFCLFSIRRGEKLIFDQNEVIL